MSNKYRIIHFGSEFAIQQYIPERTTKYKKFLFFGKVITTIHAAYWSIIGYWEGTSPNYRFVTTTFPSVELAENYIKGLTETVVKEIEV